ncbi:MAG: hypothetical protein LBT51_00560 [Fusobacteriaceae bacterium]|nr:hypothetical protein [Fusobacteriaceae bacterium]
MKICNYCGAKIPDGKILPKLQRNSTIGNTSGNVYDVFIIVFVIIIFTTSIIQILIEVISPTFFIRWGIFYKFFTFLRFISWFLPVFVIKNKNLKTIGIIAIAIPTAYRISNMLTTYIKINFW